MAWLLNSLLYMYVCVYIHSATTFETFEINEHSFMTKALLQALDCSREKMLKSDVYDLIMEC